MKRLLATGLCLLIAGAAISAQEKQNNKPAPGSWSIGVSFNALGLGKAVSQPDNGAGAADFIKGNSAFVSRQMGLFTQDPLAKISVKYRSGEHFSFRLGAGFSGSVINYREYVIDDLAKALNENSEKQVFDVVKGNLNTVGISLGAEYHFGPRNVEFIVGVGLNYMVGGGKAKFSYGNVMTAANPKPSTVGLANKDLNEYDPANKHLDMAFARPVERYSQGYTHGFGLSVDFGIEWFFIKKASLQAAIGMTPVIYNIQPQTWAKYEGYSDTTCRVEQYNDLVSPGSDGFLYGTNNISLSFGLNYYF